MDICIIGGGASGMILASKIHNKKVTIFDTNSKLGKKLLMTGNGKFATFRRSLMEKLMVIFQT